LWEPNREAARRLAKKIFPIVRRNVPAAELYLAGLDPSGFLRSLHHPEAGVHAIGRVEDSGKTIREAAVFAVPLRVGGGVRLKILEALANERPVVTTPVGAEGIPLAPGRHALIADRNEEIAEGIVSLLSEPERAAEVAREGRLLVEERFGWDNVVDRLEALLIRIGGGDRSGRPKAIIS
jgi:glycosyltransferase involved in cell wall biosynthesis